MSMDIDISNLLDFYAPILTEKQAEFLDYYYNADLSLGEIAQNQGISRQGVRDSIKRGEETLLEIEKKLGFVSKFSEITDTLEKIKINAKELSDQNSSENINKNSNKIVDLIEELEKIM